MDRHDHSRSFARDEGTYRRNGGGGDYSMPNRERSRVGFAPNGSGAQRSLGDLFRDLAGEAQTLVHQEVQLAKTELAEKVSAIGKHSGLLIGGGLVAYAGFIICLMAIGFLLGSFMPDWLGFLFAGLVVVIVGAITLKKGLSGLERTRMSLEKTGESIDESKRWLKEEASDVKKDPAHLGSHR